MRVWSLCVHMHMHALGSNSLPRQLIMIWKLLYYKNNLILTVTAGLDKILYQTTMRYPHFLCTPKRAPIPLEDMQHNWIPCTTKRYKNFTTTTPTGLAARRELCPNFKLCLKNDLGRKKYNKIKNMKLSIPFTAEAMPKCQISPSQKLRKIWY